MTQAYEEYIRKLIAELQKRGFGSLEDETAEAMMDLLIENKRLAKLLLELEPIVLQDTSS